MEVKNSISKNDLLAMLIGDELRVKLCKVNVVRQRVVDCNFHGRNTMPEMKWESESKRAEGYVSIKRTR